MGSGGVGVVGGCCSMRRRKVGGTTRPGADGLADGSATTAGGTPRSTSVSGGEGTSAVASTWTGAAAGASSTTGGGGSAGVSSTGSGSSSGAGGASASTGGVGAGGLTVLTRRGGGRAGAAGLSGSGAFRAGADFLPFPTGVSAKMSPVGKAILRCRARRSTNWRPTTSSIVLDALFTSMPWSRLSSADTSWLVVPNSSATL